MSFKIFMRFISLTSILVPMLWNRNSDRSAYLISKSCISCKVRVLATSSSCRMFSSRRLASASGCSRIVAAGASSDRDGCCTTIVAWVDRLLPPPALPPFGYEKFIVRYPVLGFVHLEGHESTSERSVSRPRVLVSRVASHSVLAECVSGVFRLPFVRSLQRRNCRGDTRTRCVSDDAFAIVPTEPPSLVNHLDDDTSRQSFRCEGRISIMLTSIMEKVWVYLPVEYTGWVKGPYPKKFSTVSAYKDKE